MCSVFLGRARIISVSCLVGSSGFCSAALSSLAFAGGSGPGSRGPDIEPHGCFLCSLVNVVVVMVVVVGGSSVLSVFYNFIYLLKKKSNLLSFFINLVIKINLLLSVILTMF
jgi:hypothetical protein